MLKTRTTKAEAAKEGIKVSFDGKDAKTYDLILVSVGRVPNGKRIGADRAGIQVDERGFISVDSQMRTNVSHIFAIGDIAATRCSRTRRCTRAMSPPSGRRPERHFDARVIPRGFTDPRSPGRRHRGRGEEERMQIGVAKFPWAASGRRLPTRAMRLHQADLRRRDAPHRRRRHRRHRRRRLISEIAHAVEMGPTRPTSARPSTASDAQRIGRHGGGAVRWASAPTCRRSARSESGSTEKTGRGRSAQARRRDRVVGVGSGSTVNLFIDALASIKGRIEGAVAASEASAERLRKARHPRVRPEQRR